MIDPGLLVALIGAATGILGTVITQRMARGAQREILPAQMLTQLSSDLSDVRERLAESEARERIRDNYIHELRSDLVHAGLVPRPWPDGLTK